jgi:hypothetical protein
VIVAAHGGGARLVASELNASPPERREQVLNNLRAKFAYPLDVFSLTNDEVTVQYEDDPEGFRGGAG